MGVIIENGCLIKYIEDDVKDNVNISNRVTHVAEKAFCDCVRLKEIALPASLKSIGCMAFKGCSSLTRIVIPPGVTIIDEFAFKDCVNLEKILIPKSVAYVGKCAFDDTRWQCSHTEKFVIVGDDILLECRSLEKSVVIPTGVKSIAAEAFKAHMSLEKVVIPDSVTYIGDLAFAYCNRLKEIVFPNSITEFGYDAFYRTRWLTEKPCGFKVLDNGLLYDYWGKERDITIPENVRRIGKWSFQHGQRIRRIVIPAGVEFIESNALVCCQRATIATPYGSCAHEFAIKHGYEYEEIVINNHKKH